MTKTNEIRPKKYLRRRGVMVLQLFEQDCYVIRVIFMS